MIRTLLLSLLLTVALAAQTKTAAKDEAYYANAAEAASKKADAAPKDAAARTAAANALFEQGDFLMNNEKLPPFKKYPAALRSFRKVLAYDKAHKKALANIATIEGIYKSMGRPVPQ